MNPSFFGELLQTIAERGRALLDRGSRPAQFLLKSSKPECIRPDRLFLRHFGCADYALPGCRRFALFIAAVRLAARGRAAVRSRDLRRRRARCRLVRRLPRPDRGREEISVAAVRHHPRDPLLGQSRPRRAQRGRRKDLALDRRGPRTRHRLRRRQPHHRRHALYGLPVVGRAIGQAAPRDPVADAAADGRRAGSGCITRRRRIRRPAGAASASSATSNWCNGSRAISRRW